jgi:hypothetical protein
MEPNKVYVVHQRDFDLSKAKTYGELVVMFEGSIDNIFNLTHLAYLVKSKLKDMHSNDYLVLSGNMVLNVLAVATALQNFGLVNVLLYDIKRAEYVPRLLAKHHLDMGGYDDRR